VESEAFEPTRRQPAADIEFNMADITG
jgi:hypothetical protein